jgi:hypothetical protein
MLSYRNMMKYDALASLGAAGMMDIHALAQWISKLLYVRIYQARPNFGGRGGGKKLGEVLRCSSAPHGMLRLIFPLRISKVNCVT